MYIMTIQLKKLKLQMKYLCVVGEKKNSPNALCLTNFRSQNIFCRNDAFLCLQTNVNIQRHLGLRVRSEQSNLWKHIPCKMPSQYNLILSRLFHSSFFLGAPENECRLPRLFRRCQDERKVPLFSRYALNVNLIR